MGGTALLIAGGMSTQAAAKPGGKGKGAPADVIVPDDYSTVQAAVDAADSGDTVLLDGGTYREQVTIAKDLTMKGQADATIEAPGSLTPYTIVESGTIWKPIVFAYGGSVSGAEVSGSETVSVDITGVTVDGRGTSGQSGILYRNVGGSTNAAIRENSVVNLPEPGGSIGIVAYGDSDVSISGNNVIGFGRGGIGANGDGGTHPSPRVAIRDNEIDARAEAGGSAPNGVQIGYGASAQVQDNTIKSCRYANSADSTWQASGILIFESDGVAAKQNNLENNDVAIAASAWGWFADSADNTKITGNTISDALIGVNLRCTAWGFSNDDPSVSNNKVVNNEISDPDNGPAGAIGVAVESSDQSDDYTPTVENNKVIRNSITGFDEQTSDEGTDSKIHAIEP